MPRIFITPLSVGEAAIDVHGHVNNQEYLRWMQDIAIEHSTAQGWPMARYLETSASWYVRSHLIEYLRPGRLGDAIRVCTWVANMEKRNSLRRTVFLRDADHSILARAETQWIFVDLKSGRPLIIPDPLRQAFDLVGTEAEALREIGWTAG